MDKFIFDVDGTLTPSRGQIDPEFKKFFNEFCRLHPVYLVTGSDKPKTVEQIGEDTYNLCHTVYNCNGNDVWQSKKHIRTNEFILPSNVYEYLSEKLNASSFPLRTGNHIETRPGMVNFSVVGRNATLGERKLYVKYDMERGERSFIAKMFNDLFPGFEAKVGGETGIDISATGADKSQIVNDFDTLDTLYFYGDRMDPAGNDYPLKKKIVDNNLGYCYNVDNWKQTWELLNEYTRNDRLGDTGN